MCTEDAEPGGVAHYVTSGVCKVSALVSFRAVGALRFFAAFPLATGLRVGALEAYRAYRRLPAFVGCAAPTHTEKVFHEEGVASNGCPGAREALMAEERRSKLYKAAEGVKKAVNGFNDLESRPGARRYLAKLSRRDLITS